jgi:predicted homoserine dehydrogenase-like protein
LKASIVPALSVRAGGPIPANLASGKPLKRDLPAGTVVAREDIEIPDDSFLMKLRMKQDDLFGVNPAGRRAVQ